MELQIVCEDSELKPSYGSKGASAFDLRISADAVVKPGEVVKVGTGVKVAVPEGYGLLILPRSSTQFELWNTVGLIDSDYRGEIFVKMKNKSKEALWFAKGDRIVQACLIPMARPQLKAVKSLSTTDRGEGGFGSTGAK